MTVFFVYLYNPTDFLELLINQNNSTWLIEIIGLIAVSFIISSITEGIINKRQVRKSYGEKDLQILKEKLKNWDVDFNETYQQELASWVIIQKHDHDENGKIQNQVDKRWHMAMANFNSASAIIIAWIILFIMHAANLSCFLRGISYWYLLLSIGLFILFFYNGSTAKNSVLDIDRLLLKKFEPEKTKL